MKTCLVASLLLCLSMAHASSFLQIFKDAHEDYQNAMIRKIDGVSKTIGLKAIVQHVTDALATLNIADKFTETETLKIAKAIQAGVKTTGESAIVNMRIIRSHLETLYEALNDHKLFTIINEIWIL
ncbi:hypothetical protein PoB_002339200 [Plakobranchus ocellatus]|uniref:Uncharacterized protein n=1 Tax=Plakobranchus ocellatus TaxID=259542 RepID=A0AAV3ZNV2_9GAST|nr:hypothetical protein PoB_002339200 [Plakobranchus ocellatus]